MRESSSGFLHPHAGRPRPFKGTLRTTRPDELAAIAIKAALARVPQLDPKRKSKDVILGCAHGPEARAGDERRPKLPLFRAGLPVEGLSRNHQSIFVSSGLQGRSRWGGRNGIMAGGGPTS